jgi:hypothetical protein
MCVTSAMFKKLSRENYHPLVENSPQSGHTGHKSQVGGDWNTKILQSLSLGHFS